MTLTDLSLKDAPLIGAILADAFADDPLTDWILGNHAARQVYFTGIAQHIYLLKGFGHRTARNEGGALWLPPNRSREISFLNELKIGLRILRHAGPQALIKGMRFDTAVNDKMPQGAYYYLHAIGVRPDNQGKGIGKTLLSPVLERCDAEGMPAYLESSKEKNLAIYGHFGFEIIEKLYTVPGAPPIWRMWREARV